MYLQAGFRKKGPNWKGMKIFQITLKHFSIILLKQNRIAQVCGFNFFQ